ncbi:Helix-turn-helix domain protein [compost metagenome]
MFAWTSLESETCTTVGCTCAFLPISVNHPAAARDKVKCAAVCGGLSCPSVKGSKMNNNNPCVERPVVQSFSSPGQAVEIEPGCLLRSQRTTDIDDQAASLTGWSQVYDQLSPGKYEGSVTECWIEDLQIIREHSNQCMHQLGHSWAGSRTFIIPMLQKGEARFGSRVIDAGDPVTLGPGQELDFRTPPVLDVMSVVLSTETVSSFSQITEGQDLEATLKGCHFLHTEAAGLAELRSFFAATFEMIQHTPHLLEYSAVRKGLRHALLTGLFATCAIPETRRSGRRALAHKQVVDKARAYVLENTLEPVTIAELCSVLGVSRRTLQMCFQEIMGTNPIHYLRAVRLNRVRRDLRRSEPGKARVQDVACHWGFWHLSSFTADYKRMFGELPSQTLSKPH